MDSNSSSPTASLSTDSNGSAVSESERCPGNLCAYVSGPAFSFGCEEEEDVDSLLHKPCNKCSSQAELEPLCNFCRHLRLRHLTTCLHDKLTSLWINFDLVCESRGRGISRILSKKGCALCSVLAHAMQSHFAMSKQQGEDEERILAQTQLSLQLKQEYGKDHLLLFLFTLPGVIEIEIAYRGSGQGSAPTIGEHIRWPAVQQWIQKCSDQHDCARSEHSTVPRGFRLIDVENRKVVSNFPMGSRLGRDIKFVALSYVWGVRLASRNDALLGSNEHELTASNGLRKNILPQAVEDAMTVCQELGQRFLWVDRFCIQQDGTEREKKEQINAMGDIYSSAEFTIIHASGTTMDHPIAGVSTTREIFQLRTVVCGLEFTTGYPDLENALQASAWSERGWTYQEAILSRRKLFFTPFELWFECNDDHAPYQREDQCSMKRHPMYSTDLDNPALEQYRLNDYAESTTRFQDFVRHLQSYTRRSLTYQSDIMDAFQGILNTLYEGGPIIYGLPEADFDRALLWYCKTKWLSNVGITSFPSWSWASVSHAVAAPTDYYDNGFRGALVQWFYKNQNGELRPIRSKNNLYTTGSSDISAQALLLIAWWKGCIEPEIPEDVGQTLEKDVQASWIGTGPFTSFSEVLRAYKHGKIFANCESKIAQRWTCPEDVWTDIRRAQASGDWETQDLRGGLRGEDRFLMEKLSPGVLLTRAQTAHFRVFMDVYMPPGDCLCADIYLTDSGGRIVGMINPEGVNITLQMALDHDMPELSQGDSLECMGVSLVMEKKFPWDDSKLVALDSRCNLKHRLREQAIAISDNAAFQEPWRPESDWGFEISQERPLVNVLVIHRQEGSPFARRIGVGWVTFGDWLEADRTFSTVCLE